MKVTLGPIPSESAIAWIDNAWKVLLRLRDDPTLPAALPPGAADAIESYFREWLAVAASAPVFEWSGDEEPTTLRMLTRYWYAVASLVHEEAGARELPVAPPEAEPFYNALVHAVLDALDDTGRPDLADLAGDLRQRWPGMGSTDGDAG